MKRTLITAITIAIVGIAVLERGTRKGADSEKGDAGTAAAATWSPPRVDIQHLPPYDPAEAAQTLESASEVLRAALDKMPKSDPAEIERVQSLIRANDELLKLLAESRNAKGGSL